MPPLGTASRSRDFCDAWLGLSRPERHAVVLADERLADAQGPEAACRAGLRSALRHQLDTECRNWSQLMDFEVRAIVDRVLRPCSAAE